MTEFPLRVYIERTGSTGNRGGSKPKTPPRPPRLRVYVPSRLRRGRSPGMTRVAWTAELGAIAERQAAERERRRKGRAVLSRLPVRQGPGHPRQYADHEALAAIGAYRRGPTIHFRRDIAPDERARRRYRLLAPEWRRAVSEDEYVRVELRVTSLRKRANRLQLAWDEAAAWSTAFAEVLADRCPDEEQTTKQTGPGMGRRGVDDEDERHTGT